MDGILASCNYGMWKVLRAVRLCLVWMKRLGCRDQIESSQFECI